MQIIWYGQSCFKIISQEVTILTNPFSPQEAGFKNPRVTSEIVIFSSYRELSTSALRASADKKDKIKHLHTFIFYTPGEYEIKNIFIQGIPHFEKNFLKTVYKLELENIKICFLGEISKTLTDEEIEKLGEVDILLLPVSKNDTLSFKEVLNLISRIEPAIVVPSCWRDKKELAPLIKEIGLKGETDLDKLKIKKKDISNEKIELVILRIHPCASVFKSV